MYIAHMWDKMSSKRRYKFFFLAQSSLNESQVLNKCNYKYIYSQYFFLNDKT